MEITWLGHSCFRFKGKEATLLTDPYDPSTGYPLGRPTATIVTVSHDHPGHNHVAGIASPAKVLRGPGEYEVAGVFVLGFPAFHDSVKGERLGRNTIFVIDMEGLVLCHLGDLGHLPSASEAASQLSNVDVLLVPVGGGNTINGAQAAELISLLGPRLVLPMHYKTEVVKRELEPVDRFLKEMGIKEIPTQPRLNLTRSNLPSETKVVLLDWPRAAG